LREVTAGTAVVATAVWRGPAADIEDQREIFHPGNEESVGLLVPTSRTYVGRLGAALSIPETELTFEQFPHVLEAGIMTATPSGSGPYVRAYSPSLTAAVRTIRAYTIETGNKLAGDAHEMPYSFVESFTLSGRTGEAWKQSSNWRGRQKVEAALTGSLALPAVEEALFSKTSVYIDAGGGTIGTTQVTGVLLEASITVTTGIVPVFSADGQLFFIAHKFVKPSLEYSLTMELHSGGVVNAERAAFESQAMRLIRFAVPGSTADRALEIDIAGKHTAVGGYQNSEENTTVQISGEAKYSSADSLFFAFEVTNGVATM
jgi:hypothetical protein